MFHKQIKVINVNAADVAAGKPTSVLALLWTIMSNFTVSFDLNKKYTRQSKLIIIYTIKL